MKSKAALAWLIIAGGLLFSGCNYDFPLTAQPTRKIDARLLGRWVAVDMANPKEAEHMDVRQWDDSSYVVSLDDNIYRAFHSDFASVPFLSVQDLNSDDRKYVYYTWKLSADSAQLSLRAVNNEIVPDNTKDQAAMQQLITRNLTNPKLFESELQFTRKMSGTH